ncbi:MAG: membrane integrity-associated transporter subunit PqiC [Opitutales bacterium]|nr:membrane integrity-associated transporter subunit PqiC [Opitutales bacterium]
MKLLRTALAVSALACAASLSGCISDLLAPSADPTVFHLISPVSMQKASAGKFDANLLPIQLPQYMSRAQIVSVDSGGALDISEFDRWAEFPSSGIERAVAVNIESSGAASVFAYPAVSPNPEKACSLKIFVYECLGEVGGKVRLQGKWQIDLPEGSKSVVKNFNFEVSSKDGYAGYSAAVSELVGRLSAQISAELSKL